jgi:iron-sulfur cluster assembly accessory protein
MVKGLNIIITANAMRHLLKMSGPTKSIGLTLTKKGCSGSQIMLTSLHHEQWLDRVCQHKDGLYFWYHPCDYEQLDGIILDFETDSLGGKLTIKHPQAQSYCGCGESFFLKEATR